LTFFMWSDITVVTLVWV